ncbi:MAG: hypothetical protein AMJ89_04970 [candidate division Zixibacteria bacterium SM23_73]|nr:MAG: hypothetical protein AMJ89_04970 [candidate division Zixibacteria bacterium SM23_73]
MLKKCFWSAKACFCDFFELWMCLYPNYLIFEKNRTSKLVHSDLRFSNSPFSSAQIMPVKLIIPYQRSKYGIYLDLKPLKNILV